MLQFVFSDLTASVPLSMPPSPLDLFASGYWVSSNCVWKLSYRLVHDTPTLPSRFGLLDRSHWSFCICSQVTLRVVCLTGAPADPVAMSEPESVCNKASPLIASPLSSLCVPMLKSFLPCQGVSSDAFGHQWCIPSETPGHFYCFIWHLSIFWQFIYFYLCCFILSCVLLLAFLSVCKSCLPNRTAMSLRLGTMSYTFFHLFSEHTQC